MKTLFRLLLTLLLFLLLFIISPFHLNTDKGDPLTNEELINAKVIEVLESDSQSVQKVKVLVKEGEFKDKEFIVDNTLMMRNNKVILKKKDEVLLLIQGSDEENLTITTYQYVREKKLLHLALFFILLVVVIGGVKGVHAILSVGFTICVISVLLLPGLLSGKDPIKLTIMCSFLIAIFSLIIQHGFSKKTISSFVGTVGGVVTAGIVTLIMSNSLQVSINSEELMSLLRISQNINFNFQSLLFSGIVIGALGANIDMSMSVATAMNEIKESNKNITRAELIKCGMNVGRDVIGTMSNTLVLAYVGSAVVTFMIFIGYNIDFNYIINLEDISIEILRSLAGSIGIILSVPLTVFTRALMEDI